MRRLADFRGKTVVLEWTNADCPYTRKHYTSGNMQSLQELARAARRGLADGDLLRARQAGLCRRRRGRCS